MSRIVHLFGAMDPGGAELRMLELVRARRHIEQEHIFVTLSGRPGTLASEFEAAGCEVIPRSLDWTFPIWFALFLRRRQVSHLHSHVHRASGYFLALGLAAGISRRIAHLRSSGDGRSNSLGRRLHRRVGHALLSLCATDIVGVSEAVLTSVMGRTSRVRRKCRVIYGQVNGFRFLVAGQAKPQTSHLLVVGRLDRDKNPMRILEIAATFMQRHPALELTVRFAGHATSEEAATLNQRASDLRIAEQISFLGVRNDVPELLGTSDMLVSTTLREGLPGAVIEASASGIPSVVSAIPPNEEVGVLLPCVVTVPLDAADEVWADVIVDVLAQRHDRLRPAAVRAWFEGSPFALDEQKELDHLWS